MPSAAVSYQQLTGLCTSQVLTVYTVPDALTRLETNYQTGASAALTEDRFYMAKMGCKRHFPTYCKK